MNGIELLDKYLKGDVTEEAFNAGLGSLTPEQKTEYDAHISTPEVRKQLKEAADKELAKVSGLRKEGKRLEGEPAPAATDFGTQMRNENVEKAFGKLFSAYSIAPEQQAKYRTLFEGSDTKKVDPDLIFADLQKIYAAENSSELLAVREQFESFKAGADEFALGMAGPAGGSGEGSGGNGGKTYPQAVYDYVNEARKQGIPLTLEAANKVLTQGFDRSLA